MSVQQQRRNNKRKVSYTDVEIENAEEAIKEDILELKNQDLPGIIEEMKENVGRISSIADALEQGEFDHLDDLEELKFIADEFEEYAQTIEIVAQKVYSVDEKLATLMELVKSKFEEKKKETVLNA